MKGKALVIVESPSKAKTIGKILGSRYKVIASVGHVRDLPKSKLGINIENNFEPEYISIRGKGDVIKMLKKEAKSASKVYLATDPDREGEAISWHIANLLGIDEDAVCRVEFNEITKNAVKEAVKKPRAIDRKLLTPSRRDACWTGWLDTRSVRCCGEKSASDSAPEEFSRRGSRSCET